MKTGYRKSLIEARRAIPANEREIWDAAIGRAVLEWWRTHRLHPVGVFWPIQGEPDLRPWYRLMVKEGAELALPVVKEKSAPLVFYPWRPGDALMKDVHGIPVPALQERAVRTSALLVPCVGFNDQKMRLGYGAGYYDRTLAALPRPYTLGIAYSNAHSAFEAAPHDVALDQILTELSGA